MSLIPSLEYRWNRIIAGDWIGGDLKEPAGFCVRKKMDQARSMLCFGVFYMLSMFSPRMQSHSPFAVTALAFSFASNF